MASTNKTTHYNLSQYIGTDKPTYLVDYNTDMANIDAGIYGAKAEADANSGAIGNLSNLETTDKSSLVGAVNEVNAKANNIGNLSNLTTEAQSNLVSAINEVDAEADANNQNIGTMTNLETTVKTSLVGAINEVNTKTGTNATNIGNLSNLETTDKDNLVEAINQVLDMFNYSTTPKKVGKYSNGKDIYRKVIEGTVPAGNVATFIIDPGVTNFTMLPMTEVMIGKGKEGFDGTYGYRFEKASATDLIVVAKTPAGAYSGNNYTLILYYYLND